jgi:hypothetical protein
MWQVYAIGILSPLNIHKSTSDACRHGVSALVNIHSLPWPRPRAARRAARAGDPHPHPHRADPSRPEPTRADPSRPEPSRADPVA